MTSSVTAAASAATAGATTARSMTAAGYVIGDGGRGCTLARCAPPARRGSALGAARMGAVAEVHALEHPRHECHGGQAHDDVDHVGRCPGPQDLLDDVEVEEGDHGPVEGAEQDEPEP